MTADPIAPVVAVLTAAGLNPSTRIEGDPPRYVRLDLAGGFEEIRGYHDQVLMEIHCVNTTMQSAAADARTARAALTNGHGIRGQALISKITTAPPRFHDDDRRDRGHVSFPAQVFLHPWPVAP